MIDPYNKFPACIKLLLNRKNKIFGQDWYYSQRKQWVQWSPLSDHFNDVRFDKLLIAASMWQIGN